MCCRQTRAPLHACTGSTCPTSSGGQSLSRTRSSWKWATETFCRWPLPLDHGFWHFRSADVCSPGEPTWGSGALPSGPGIWLTLAHHPRTCSRHCISPAQVPLQPLQDNLESQTYEVFEKDTTKYAQYELAILQALQSLDRRAAAATASTSQPQQLNGPVAPARGDHAVVIFVVGAGRGPLVRASLQAGQRAGRAVKVYAVEKNPNAVITLHRLVAEQRCVPGQAVAALASTSGLPVDGCTANAGFCASVKRSQGHMPGSELLCWILNGLGTPPHTRLSVTVPQPTQYPCPSLFCPSPAPC